MLKDAYTPKNKTDLIREENNGNDQIMNGCLVLYYEEQQHIKSKTKLYMVALSEYFVCNLCWNTPLSNGIIARLKRGHGSFIACV